MAIALGGVQLLSHGPFSLHAVMLEVGRRWNLFSAVPGECTSVGNCCMFLIVVTRTTIK